MVTQIKPIETQYKGYRMRSRLEARWAVFFDALEIPWEYEKEGFDLGEAGWYLPDFWLPKQQTWIEVKPTNELPEDEWRKAFALAAQSDEQVVIMHGSPWSTTLTTHIRHESNAEECRITIVQGFLILCPCCGDFGWFSDKPPEDGGKETLQEYQLAVRLATNDPRLVKAYTAARSARFERRS